MLFTDQLFLKIKFQKYFCFNQIGFIYLKYGKITQKIKKKNSGFDFFSFSYSPRPS
jgi:hypothetical protein